MSINWDGILKRAVDLGSESYEQRKMRMVLQTAAVVLFVLVAWKLLNMR